MRGETIEDNIIFETQLQDFGYGPVTVNGIVQAWGMISGAAITMFPNLRGRSAI
jgi:hypothetical protein